MRVISRRLREHSLATFNLASTASTVTKTMIAVLTLVAVVLVVVGLVRAWKGRRRAQVVIEDVASVEGIPVSASAGLSPQLRQAVRLALVQETLNASYSVLNTLEQDIRGGLLLAHGRIRMKTIAAGLRSRTEDSLATLAVGLQAVAPKQADGLLAALGAALPAQRGWVVHSYPVFRGAGPNADIGIVLEIAQLGNPPDAVTTFWTYSDDLRSATTDAAYAAAMRALLYLLLPPAAAWIATRLASRQLAQSDVPMRWRVLAGRKLDQELVGLRMQLAGQMSLYAIQKQKDFDRGFAGQALSDLAEAARLLPEYYRPFSTQAAVHERLGWSYRRSGDAQQAATEFVQAVRNYDEAAHALSALVASDPAERAGALQRVDVRRTKCRLLSRDPAYLIVAQQELIELSRATWSTTLELYNAACLFAVAMACSELLPHDRSAYGGRAWHLLGCALLADGAKGPWGYVMTDIELDAMAPEQRSRFTNELKTRHPSQTPLGGERARQVVDKAMTAIGLDPVDSS